MFRFTIRHYSAIKVQTAPTAAATRRKDPWHKETSMHAPGLNQHVYESEGA